MSYFAPRGSPGQLCVPTGRVMLAQVTCCSAAPERKGLLGTGKPALIRGRWASELRHPAGEHCAAVWKNKDVRSSHAHSSAVHNTQRAETTQVSTDGWMEKQSMAYGVQGAVIRPPKGRKFSTTRMNLENIMLRK